MNKIIETSLDSTFFASMKEEKAVTLASQANVEECCLIMRNNLISVDSELRRLQTQLNSGELGGGLGEAHNVESKASFQSLRSAASIDPVKMSSVDINKDRN